jgi:hypothetical protein
MSQKKSYAIATLKATRESFELSLGAEQGRQKGTSDEKNDTSG